MSRDLGPKQRQAIALMRTARDGLLVADLVPALGVTERRVRAILATLAARGMATVTYDRGGRARGWNPRHLEYARFEQDHQAWVLERLGPVRCPRCEFLIRPDPRGPRRDR